MTDLAVRSAHAELGYGGGPVLRRLEFEIPAGTRVGLLGPNGGGKTTLFRALAGELKPLAGKLEINQATATVPQTDRTRLDYPVSARDVVLMGTLPTLPWWRRPGRTERARARDELERVGLAAVADRRYGSLSGGQRQRVLIARALATGAGLLLLDEPFTGLDTAGEERLERLIDRLAAEGRTVLIATHEIEQAARWDLVLCLNREQIAFGEPEETLTRPVLEATYGPMPNPPAQPDLTVLTPPAVPGRERP